MVCELYLNNAVIIISKSLVDVILIVVTGTNTVVNVTKPLFYAS